MQAKQIPDPGEARKAARLTMAELAAKASCDVSTVFRCEKSKEYPRNVRKRRAYLAALNLPTDA
jgi:hypothetical protein